MWNDRYTQDVRDSLITTICIRFFLCEVKNAPVATIKLKGVVHLCEISSPVIMPHVWSTAKILKGHGQTARVRPNPELLYINTVDGCGSAEPYWQSVNTAPPPMDFDKKADGAFKTSIPPILGSHAGVFIACLAFFCLVGGIFSEYLYLHSKQLSPSESWTIGSQSI